MFAEFIPNYSLLGHYFSMQAPAPLIDIGVNLTSSRFSHDLLPLVQRARIAQIESLIITATDLPSCHKALDLCLELNSELKEQYCYTTCGVHPHCASTLSTSTTETLRLLCRQSAVVAIGETGLDFNRNYSSPAEQINAFEAQLALAAELNLPVFMHERDSHPTFIAIVKSYRDVLSSAVVHCFTGDKTALFDYLDMDLHIGITGWICDKRRGTVLQQLVHNIPLNRLMLETDAPYLLPHDLPIKPKNKRNEPAFLPYVLAKIADNYPATAEEIAVASNKTSRQFFNLAMHREDLLPHPKN